MFDKPLDILVIVFALLSSVILMIGYFPLVIKLLKTRQTYGISFFFNSLITFACFVWIIYGILSLLDDPNNPDDTIDERLLTSLPILVSNSFLLILNGIALFLKVEMIHKGKKNHMTEKEYCDLYYQKKHREV